MCRAGLAYGKCFIQPQRLMCAFSYCPSAQLLQLAHAIHLYYTVSSWLYQQALHIYYLGLPACQVWQIVHAAAAWFSFQPQPHYDISAPEDLSDCMRPDGLVFPPPSG